MSGAVLSIFMNLYRPVNFGKFNIISGIQQLKHLCLAAPIKLTGFLIIAAAFSSHNAAAKAPHIVVTIKPLHSIVANITSGVATPELLLPDSQSPHTFRLKPSHRSAIEKADLVFWVGPQYELHLEKIMGLYPQKTVALIESPGIHLLKNRSDRDFLIEPPSPGGHSTHAHNHESDLHQHTHDHGEIDGHIWLSIENAIALAEQIANKLIAFDPPHREVYQQNLQRTTTELQALKQLIKKQLPKTKVPPYLVFHDAYQYFEREFELNSVGAVLINPHIPLTPRAIYQVRALVNHHQVRCIFYEPEFNHNILKPLLNTPNLSLQELDPLGVRQQKGLDCYKNMMLALASQLLSCQPEPSAQ